MGLLMRNVVSSTGGFFLDDKGPVWSMKGLEQLLIYAERHGLVILGCDVITLSGEYTYDNWFFQPCSSKPLLLCSAESIHGFLKYIEDYTEKNGDDFWVGVVIFDLQ